MEYTPTTSARYLTVGYSEVCCHINAAGRQMVALACELERDPGERCCQLVTLDDGRPYSAPILRNEAGWRDSTTLHRWDVVIQTTDVDCDGVGHAYHRVSVPTVPGSSSPLGVLRTQAAVVTFAKLTEQLSSYYDCASVISLAEFGGRVLPHLDDHDRRYWTEVGYFGEFAAR